MRELIYSGAFQRDLKRESKGQYAKVLESELLDVVNALANDANGAVGFLKTKNENLQVVWNSRHRQ
jgi:mRNA-degrading endonuclease YafQ of YafQ-DinJ toxin-antitoxin module